MIHAEAILRRQGYEVASQSAMQGLDPSCDLPKPPRVIDTLVCTHCGYDLTGLRLERASVICTECSYPQPLMAWTQAQADSIRRTIPLVAMLSVLGVMATVLFVVLIVSALAV